MAFVSRDGGGKINGFFRCRQPAAIAENGDVICVGVATSEIPDDDPELLDFFNRIVVEGVP